ncbi:hypothetical protein K490DRAFT_54006 [Saccharata proteae CBS 121410]|uniref:Uncharacterized protein n=1 Tax=Saccharata proteae CBS 121410 TaxID=1314787 RepID=A0A9P4I3C1_9PEZI|nr:hypothetical protein K490DRAFT_54006 [Saccharata proteae CBS 121410]
MDARQQGSKAARQQGSKAARPACPSLDEKASGSSKALYRELARRITRSTSPPSQEFLLGCNCSADTRVQDALPSTPNICAAAALEPSEAPPSTTATMCTKVVHSYSCGHQTVNSAPCATSRNAQCGVLNTKHVKHDEKCDACAG